MKMYALSIAQQSKWKLNVPEAEYLVNMFEDKFHEAKEALEARMPQVPVYVNKTRPKKPYKLSGEMSATGLRWKELIQVHNKDFDYTGTIKHQTGYKEPNAGSTKQLKDWLFDLGWKPITFDYKREDKVVRKIPQIKTEEGELCASIVELIPKEPALQYLEEMSVVKHRSSVVGGFLKMADSEGFIIAGATGFTNTLRLRHRTFLNVPSSRKPYGEAIRGLLTARKESYELLGSDIDGLEDTTKRHYMFPYDPDYVKEMSVEGYDSHLAICLEAGMMTQQEVQEYKDGNIGHDRKAVLSAIRHKGKSTNYASVYGAGAETIARSAGVPIHEGEILHNAYWSKNWSVKAIADDCIVKTSRDMKWLWNPVANMWYYLKVDKDRFSTLNQGTGSFLFDQWVTNILQERPQLNGQAHDEVILEIKKGFREPATELVKNAMAMVNNKYQLNVPLTVDVQFSDTYAGVH